MHPEPSKWYCDVCGEPIDDAKSGYVIWRSAAPSKDRDFKIIHQSRCDRKNYESSNALEDFLGPRGVAYLLSFLSVGPALHNPQGGYNKVADMDEFVDFFRRCQTPFYEEARRRFQNERFREDFGDSNELYPYLPETLKRICENYEPAK